MRRVRLITGLMLLPFSIFAQQFTEIVGRPTNSSITINALFDTQVETYFEYGTSKGNYQKQTAVITSIFNQPVETKIEGLLQGTRYYYRTLYRKIGQTTYLASPEHTFITQRKPGSTFRFTIEADPHSYDKKGCWPLWDLCLSNQLSDTADFMIDMGDTFGDDHEPFTITNTDIQKLLLNCRNFFGKVCHSLPFFFCIGNHEGESGYYLLQTPPNNLAMYETNWRKLYYPNPYPDSFYTGDTIDEGNGVGQAENYFAWTWGDALFVVLDVYRYADATEKPQKWDFTIGKTQYDWFKKTLETSTAKYKFVFAHHVLGQGRGGVELAKSFEWGGEDAGKYIFDTKRPGWGLPLHQLMVKNKVDIFFQGHDHIYVKQELDSVIYQSVQMPSDSSYKIGVTDNGDAYLSGKQLDGSGHLRVTVSSDSVYVECISAVLPQHEKTGLKNGQVRDAYSIVKKSSTTVTQAINQENTININYSVYPNPTPGPLNILLKTSANNKVQIQVINLEGKVLKQFQPIGLYENRNLIHVELNDGNAAKLNSGIYILRVTYGNTSSCKKLIIN